MAKPVIHTWPQYQPIYRIHPQRYASLAFNDSGLGDARFSPLILPDGKIIPTLYGGSSFQCAAMETVFHDLPRHIDDFILDFDSLSSAMLSQLTPLRELRLLSLTTVGLVPLGLKKTEVIETTVHAYPHTRALALAWQQQYPDIDGLYWISRQDDQAGACILFGDRVSAADLAISSAPQFLTQGRQLDQLLQLTRQLGISKARAFPSAIVGF